MIAFASEKGMISRTLLLGSMRFFTVQSALINGFFPVARWTVGGITLMLGALVSIVFALSLQARRSMEF